MRSQAFLCFLLLATALLSVVLASAPIDPKVLEDTEEGKIGSFSVHLHSRARLSGLSAIPREMSTERGQFVYEVVKRHAAATQRPLIQLLKNREDVLRVTPYFVANFIIVEAKREVVELLAKRHDVKAINSNRPFLVPLEKNEEEFSAESLKADEWNIVYVKAPEVWARYGTTGSGIFANADTGIDYTHPALTPNYKGYNNATGAFSHDYNWWDGVKVAAIPGSGPCGINSQVPCDDNSHGSHTTGTAIGQGGIGVAPGAKWIGCRNMDRGYGTVESYLSCLQFFLAPTDLEGNNPDSSVRPLAVGNSYGCVSSEGCSGDEFGEAVETMRAAGIFMSVSAGNSGSSCSTIDAPPATEESVISVAATAYNSDAAASYSSRGPVDGRRAPNIAAPGSTVRSCIPGGGYSAKSGTSMASPHIGGYVNLIAAICPDLAYDVDALQELLQTTARKLYTTQGCGGDTSTTTPNNVFGHGMLDLAAAAAKCRGE